MTVCKLCLENKPLLESHIIPRHAFKQTKLMPKYEAIKVLYVQSDKVDTIEDYAYDGIKEPLFCESCETIVGVYENYFSDVFYLKKIPKKYNITIIDKPWGPDQLRYYTGLNYDFVKLYYLSIFYRISMSRHSQFNDLTLGRKHNEKIRNLLLLGSGGDEEEYKIMRIRPKTKESAIGIITPIKVGALVNKNGYFWMGIFGGGYIILKISTNGEFPEEFNPTFEHCCIKSSGEMCEWVTENTKWDKMIMGYMTYALKIPSKNIK